MALSQLFFIGTNVQGQCPLPAGSFFIRVPTAALLDWLPVGKRVL